MRWKEFAAREARLLLVEWQQRAGSLTFPIPVEDIADLFYHLTIDLSTALPAGIAGRLYTQERILEVQRGDAETRQRFTIAHEIGHYRLHVLIEPLLPHGYGCMADNLDREPVETLEALPGFPPLPTASPSFTPDLARRLEIEANTFAAALLMPAELIEHAVGELGADVQRLAQHCGVSEQAMRYRLQQLLFLPPPGPQLTFL